jgi:hypothetical protein
MGGIKSSFNRAKKMKFFSSSPFEGVAFKRILKQPPPYFPSCLEG